ncbi:hypothetical protein CR513_46003, partial [Mucuna pruriens]
MVFFCGNEFKTFTKRKTRNQRLLTTQLEKIVSKEFTYWLLHWVTDPDITDVMPDEIKYLAKGPMAIARRYTAYNINGYKFKTMGRDEGLKTPNNGVFLTLNTSYVASKLFSLGASGQILHVLEDLERMLGEHEEDDPYIEASQT